MPCQNSESESEYTMKSAKKPKSKRRGRDYANYVPQKDKQNVAFFKKKNMESPKNV